MFGTSSRLRHALRTAFGRSFSRFKRWVLGGGLAGAIVGAQITEILPNFFKRVAEFLGLLKSPPSLSVSTGAATAAAAAVVSPSKNLPAPKPDAPPPNNAGTAAVVFDVRTFLNATQAGLQASSYQVRLRETGGVRSVTYTHCRWEIRARDGTLIVDYTTRLARPISVPALGTVSEINEVDAAVVDQFNAHHLNHSSEDKGAASIRISFLGSDDLGRPLEANYKYETKTPASDHSHRPALHELCPPTA